MKNVYNLELTEDSGGNKSKWVLASSFDSALIKARAYIEKEKKKTGITWKVTKLKLEGSIDIV